ncbi:hypothetical protein CXG81DRAFT_5275, partial [Caulochytrium protostelioides]
VKNKAAAAIQITAEQLLREAHEFKEPSLVIAKQKIVDEEELDAFKREKRNGFEYGVRLNGTLPQPWIRYAVWEDSVGETERARSVYERGLDRNHQATQLWIRYAEMEMAHKNLNHARNILDRAVGILPRVDALWFKYTLMEELVGHVAGARAVFERWMQWHPGAEAWMAYVQFELRHGQPQRATRVYRRYVEADPQSKRWIQWAKHEEAAGHVDLARRIYEECLDALQEGLLDPTVYISFARFEVRQQELERARAIFQFGLRQYPSAQCTSLRNAYALFEKQYGAHDVAEQAVLEKQQQFYEATLAADPLAYDHWIDYVQLAETMYAAEPERVRAVYDRAVAHVPPVLEKHAWRRYIYVWIFYAVWEELAQDHSQGAVDVYQRCLAVIPHARFTFSKIWLRLAECHVRRRELALARKTLGLAIGKAPKTKTFQAYIDLELRLREFDRVRTLFQQCLRWQPQRSRTWVQYAQMEDQLNDTDRVRALYAMALAQPVLDMPEVLWKAAIDFEIGEGEWDRAADLYERLLDQNRHVNVWQSYARFKVQQAVAALAMRRADAADPPAAPSETEQQAAVAAGRAVLERGEAHTRRLGDPAQRVQLLEAWLAFEKTFGTPAAVSAVLRRFPRTVKKRRVLQAAGAAGPSAPSSATAATAAKGPQFEEYFDYVFPDDQVETPSQKLLEMAYKWKAAAAQQ